MNGFVRDEHREKRAWSYTRTGGVTEGFRVRKWRSDGFARALFDARGAAARKRFWVSSETSLIVEVRRTRENIARPRRSWRERAPGGAPGEWSPRCCRPRFRRSRPGNCCAGGGGGSGGRCELRARGEGGRGRTREDRAVLGSREETSRAYHGVSSHDVHRLVHEHLRGHERGDGDGADHRLASLEVHLAQDRGVHGHTRVSRKLRRRTRSRDARARVRPRAGFPASHDEDVAATTGRDDENGYARAREREPRHLVAESHTVYTRNYDHPNTVFFRDCLAAREFFARPPRHSPPPRARRLASLTTPHGGRARSRRIARWFPLSPTLPRPPRFVTSRFCSAAACSASSPSSSRTRP